MLSNVLVHALAACILTTVADIIQKTAVAGLSESFGVMGTSWN